MNKIHNNLLIAVSECLFDIFNGGYYADKVIERKFKMNKVFGARDRKFIAETTYNIVRNYLLITKILGEKPENLDGYLKLTNLFLDINFYKNASKEILDKKEKYEENPRVKYSYPEYLYNLIETELGIEKWLRTSEELNKTAKLVIRTNNYKTTPQELLKKLSTEEIEGKIIEKNAIEIPRRVNLFITKAFKDGLFEVQDYSSQLVAEFLQPKPNEFIIDACAGAGGKTMHIASLLENRGKILALDIEERKLTELQIRDRRGGFSNIETRFIKNNKTIKRLKDRADKLLLDVPCSGLGVLKRNPDTKWKLSKERLDELKEIQKNILNNHTKMLKTGGTLIYATCSILPSENEKQIEQFLENNKNFKFIEDHKILPQDKGFDGFYMAKLSRIS